MAIIEEFEIGLQNIKDAMCKKSGVKQKEKVHQRIGRLKQKYRSIHKHNNIDIAYKGNITMYLNWATIQQPNAYCIYPLLFVNVQNHLYKYNKFMMP